MTKVKSTKARSQEQQPNGHALTSKFAKYLDPEVSWDKDKLCDVLHWIRQALGLACGLLWGAIPLVGAFWIVVYSRILGGNSWIREWHLLAIDVLRFLVLSSGLVYGYYAYLLKIDEEEFGGHGALLQEGLFASFSLFLLAWILVYSLTHF